MPRLPGRGTDAVGETVEAEKRGVQFGHTPCGTLIIW